MVFCALKRSLWKDSCCSVLVMKGGRGFRFFSCVRTPVTRKDSFSSSAAAALACASFSRAIFSPAFRCTRARKRSSFAVARSASSVQYSRGLNARISSSRSQMSRRATDCTRPAESP